MRVLQSRDRFLQYLCASACVGSWGVFGQRHENGVGITHRGKQQFGSLWVVALAAVVVVVVLCSPTFLVLFI